MDAGGCASHHAPFALRIGYKPDTVAAPAVSSAREGGVVMKGDDARWHQRVGLNITALYLCNSLSACKEYLSNNCRSILQN